MHNIYFLFILLFINLGENPIIDSSLSFEQSTSGIIIPERIKQNLELITITYYSFDNKLHQGQLLIDKSLTKEVKAIFKHIEETKFPIGKAVPISEYNWNDSLSMFDNNTSSFNYRSIKGTKKLSAHSYGRAIDINPLLNPHIKRGKTHPLNGSYNKEAKGTIYHQSQLVKEFKKYGWKWGGNWRSSKDYMHFQK